MKIPLLTLFIITIISNSYPVMSQQANGFVVMNYIPGTCKVQVEYWINNKTNGNGSMFIAYSKSSFQWDSSLFKLVKDSSLAPGLNLPDTLAPYRDIDQFSSRTVNGSSFRTVDIMRSTMYCNNMYEIAPQTTKPMAMVVLEFRNCTDANSYNFTDTTASNYIADINDGTSNPSLARKILVIVKKDTRPIDASGAKCNGLIDPKNLNNIPIGDTSSTLFVPQAPLPVKKIKFFNLNKVNNRSTLNWVVNDPSTLRSYEIQKKVKDEFVTIGVVNSSSNKSDYTYSDLEPLLTGVTSYRLRLLSYTGNEEFSEIKSVSNDLKSLDVTVYPNPSRGVVNIVLPAGGNTTDISMIDFSGKIVKTWMGYRIPNIQLTGLPKGIYSLIITNRETGEKTTEKITVH